MGASSESLQNEGRYAGAYEQVSLPRTADISGENVFRCHLGEYESIDDSLALLTLNCHREIIERPIQILQYSLPSGTANVLFYAMNYSCSTPRAVLPSSALGKHTLIGQT